MPPLPDEAEALAEPQRPLVAGWDDRGHPPHTKLNKRKMEECREHTFPTPPRVIRG